MRRQVAFGSVLSFLLYLGCASTTLPANNNDGSDDVVPDDAAPTGVIDAQITPIITTLPDAGTDAASGCADGTREGFENQPLMAACGGSWVGDVANGVALCAAGWHVCDGSEATFKALTYDQAAAIIGCYAVNASDDSGKCHHGCGKAVEAGVDDAFNIDMAGVGSLCPFHDKDDDSCLHNGRIDFTQNSGTGCNFAVGLSGVACCHD